MHKPFIRIIPDETFRYGVTGGLNTVLDIFLYFITYNFIIKKEVVDLGIVAFTPHIAAFLIVFPVTFFTGFLLAKYVTFTASILRGRKQLFRYALTVTGAIVLNYLLLKLFVEVFGIYPTPSKAIITIIVVIYSYMMQRYFSFRTSTILKKNRISVIQQKE
ncbi:MAG: GtrA family protein [Bacteroidales bacterium]|nr:GtrA family protein [Bacteroidales bacterium]